VRAGAAGQQAEAVAQRVDAAEGVGHASAEPAQHAGADAAQHRAILPGAAQQLVEAVGAPQRQQVHGVAAADIEDVLRGDEVGQRRRGRGLPWQRRRREQRQIGRRAAPDEGAVEARDVGRGVAHRGGQEADPDRLPA